MDYSNYSSNPYQNSNSYNNNNKGISETRKAAYEQKMKWPHGISPSEASAIRRANEIYHEQQHKSKK